MAGQPGRILVVDDEVNIREAIARILAKQGHDVAVASDGTEALAALRGGAFQVVITDLKMAGADGMAVLRAAKEADPSLEVILMTAYGTVESAVEAMKLGAYDYLTKPMDPTRLPFLVGKALERRFMGVENLQLRERLRVRDEIRSVVGQSQALRGIFEVVDQVAETDATVLLQGESGTGKELVARVLHHRSGRRDHPFVAINCGALPEIFLDEVGEMSLKSQVDFLRVVQEKEFRRLGGTRLLRVDVRIIAASNRNLEQRVREGLFREDLFYRLNVVPIHLPPLRERREDIPLLLEIFLEEFAQVHRRPPKTISREAMRALLTYDWPGNVRELRNVIERLTVTIRDDVLQPAHLPVAIQSQAQADKTIMVPLGRPMREIEREVIRRTLQEVTSHRENAARILGISPRALHYKLKRYGLLDHGE
ncbi:MAG: sigma-54-dependent Fis family transcriptional regulator [candidate division NC10 bacterium]|nr:sigma-54-dependent Fis family transcriptional regulator [candidate division NC10 bacterium]